VKAHGGAHGKRVHFDVSMIPAHLSFSLARSKAQVDLCIVIPAKAGDLCIVPCIVIPAKAGISASFSAPSSRRKPGSLHRSLHRHPGESRDLSSGRERERERFRLPSE
jgi:hypothetical protein